MRYMVDLTFLPGVDVAAIAPLFPQEQEHTRKLTEQGVVEAIYIGNEAVTHVWIVFKSDSKEALEQVLETFPLHPYQHAEVTAIL
jgi:muconolactone delta-isomerase